jgi:hypothetical protein
MAMDELVEGCRAEGKEARVGKAGYVGVSSKGGKWRAIYKRKYLGTYAPRYSRLYVAIHLARELRAPT